MLDNAGAEDRARAGAGKRLRRALEKGVDPVGCPECGWYQADMVAEARRRTLHTLIPISIVCLALAAAIAMVAGALWAAAERPWDAATWLGVGAWVGGFAGAGALGLAIRRVVAGRVDLNREFPDRPAPYPGAPVAYKVEKPTGQAPRSVAAGAAVGAYPAPPPRALKPSSKPGRRGPGA